MRQVTEEYDVPPEAAQRDLQAFLKKLKEADALV